MKNILKKDCSGPEPSEIAAPQTISHPPYYNRGKIEVIDFIEDQGLGFHLGNVVKYVCRAGHKGGNITAIEDLEKTKWYIERMIELLRKKEG